MLKQRVIPTLLYNSKMFVEKPKAFQRPGRQVGTLQQFIQNYNNRNIDELILIDIDATKESRVPYFDKIEEFTKELFCPVTLGGGICTLQDIEKALKSGADKVIIKTALDNKEYIEEAVRHFGSQCIVACIDVHKKLHNERKQDYYEYYSDKWRLDDLIEYLKEIRVGEIFLTSKEKDGTRTGYDLKLIREVSNSTSIPVIANGGCGSFSDMHNALVAGAHAVAASSIFLFTALTPNICAEYLVNKGFNCRVGA